MLIRFLKHWQLSGVADLAERLCGPYSHVTTRANLQLREVPPKHAVTLIEGIQDLGLCSRGSGADNIRNVTGTPTAGIDPQELLDTYGKDHVESKLGDWTMVDSVCEGTTITIFVNGVKVNRAYDVFPAAGKVFG